MTDNAVADADLMTLLPGLEFRFSPSPDRCWWRARRRTRSLVARGPRGSYRGVITSRATAAGAGDNVLMVVTAVSPCLGDLSVRKKSWMICFHSSIVEFLMKEEGWCGARWVQVGLLFNQQRKSNFRLHYLNSYKQNLLGAGEWMFDLD